ncbi:MAG: sigma-70 family RNA polymerase sigma factor [Sphingobacteriales bacterium]|nr:sigma-70 family RNA polymerase sigma factor [Sphingobacteriales bacterium]
MIVKLWNLFTISICKIKIIYLQYPLLLVNSDQYKHISDQQLLENFYADHNNDWLGILFPRYTLLLLGVCMKYLKNEEEAKDCVQQIFLKAITELHKYKVDYFKSWLYMVAKNHCLMKLRDKNKRPVEINENALSTANEDTDKTLLEQKDKALSIMEKALEELNEDQKKCVKLFYLDKQSYQQIADKTGFTLMQVKSYIQNGKRNLKQMIEKRMK